MSLYGGEGIAEIKGFQTFVRESDLKTSGNFILTSLLTAQAKF